MTDVHIKFEADPDPSIPDRVGASASCCASAIVADILAPAMTFDGYAIIIPKWALFRMALAIEKFVKDGGQIIDELHHDEVPASYFNEGKAS